MDYVTSDEMNSEEKHKHKLSIYYRLNQSKPNNNYSSFNKEKESKNYSISKENTFNSKKNVILEIQEVNKEDEKEKEENKKKRKEKKYKKEKKIKRK